MSLIINYLQHLKMPTPLLVLGGMYFCCALFYFIAWLRAGYWGGVLQASYRYCRRHYIVSLLTLIIVLFAIAVEDYPVSKYCHDNYHPLFYTLADFICSMGEGWFVAGVTFTLFVICNFCYQYCVDNNYHLERASVWQGRSQLARISFMLSLYAGIINGVAKFIFNRERPSIGLAPHHFFQFFVDKAHNVNNLFYAYNSMPSGHTIIVFAAITPWFMATKRTPLKILLLLCGVLMAFVRVYTLNHWLSDVILSAYLGMVIGYVGYRKWA